MNKTAKLLSLIMALVLLATVVFCLPASADETEAEAVDQTESAVETVDESIPETLADESDDGIADVGVDPTASTEAETAEATEAAANIPAVTGLRRDSAKTNSLKLIWNAVDGVSGYYVYWKNCDAATPKMTLLSSVKGTTITVTNLKDTMKFEVKVTAYKSEGGKVTEGPGTTITTGTNPAEVTNFYLMGNTPGKTLLRWKENPRADGYVLLRQSAATNGRYAVYKDLPKGTTQFVDATTEYGRCYNYKVRAYRNYGANETYYSQIYEPLYTVSGLCAPNASGSKTMLSKVMLRWSRVALAQGYDIYYSTSKVNWVHLTTTTNTSFDTHKLGYPGKYYYFRIIPYRYVSGRKTVGTYTALQYLVSRNAFGKNPGNTYIEINIAKQKLEFYVDGKLYIRSDVVTGNYNSMDTPKGFWKINSKASPCTLVGAGYTSYVNYWMAFIGSGYGIHDASWRSSFGGNIYKGNGSHGCVNTPYNNVKKIYAKAKVGTPVIVY